MRDAGISILLVEQDARINWTSPTIRRPDDGNIVHDEPARAPAPVR
jgi:hypothetical protein